MTISHDPQRDVWDGPNRIYADRLLQHCLLVQRDPQVEEFVLAVKILAHIERAVGIDTVWPTSNRVQRDAAVHTCALTLAELAQRPSSTPRDDHAR